MMSYDLSNLEIWKGYKTLFKDLVTNGPTAAARHT